MNPVLSDIRREWAWVKEGINDILEKYPWLEYRAEDVYSQCVNGTAVLYTTSNAFAVCVIEEHPLTGDKSFLMWTVWAKGKGLKTIEDFLPFMHNEAKSIGCQRIGMKSPNRAMERIFTRLGYRCDMRDFSYDLEAEA